MNAGEFYRIFTFRFSFRGTLFDTELMNFIWKYVLLIIQDNFTAQRVTKVLFFYTLKIRGRLKLFKWVKWDWRSRINLQRTMNNILMANVDPAYMHRGLKKTHSFLLFTTSTTSWISKNNARMHILFLSKRFPPVRLGYVTEVNWPRGTGKTPYRD